MEKSVWQRHLSRLRAPWIGQLLVGRLAFLVLTLGLLMALSLNARAQQGCSQVFDKSEIQRSIPRLLAESELLTADFANVKATLEKSDVLNGQQVDALNNHFNHWLTLSEKRFDAIGERMRRGSLSEAERLEALELIQSSYRSYLTVLSPIYGNTKWRRIVYRQDSGRGHDAFAIIQAQVFSKDVFAFYQDLLSRTVTLSAAEASNVSDLGVVDPADVRLWLKKAKLKAGFLRIRDLNRRAFESIIHVVTESIGITSDTFPLRKGKLFGRPEVVADMIKTLRPMDILADRANEFKLSHMIIPGYYGHVGIYLGTKNQLIELGLWDHPAIIPYHDAIESGLTMLEAKRTGVRLRALSEYLNTDSMTALRQRNLSTQSLLEKMSWGLAKVGMSFDHTFNLEHTESFFCSKLLYMVFHDIPWPTRTFFGRTSVPPDYIASMSLGEQRYFDPVLVYEKGQKIEGDLQAHIERVQRKAE
jgi:hypothetical protein